MKTLNLGDLKHQELQSEKTGEKYALSAGITQCLGFKQFFAYHEIILPGRRASGLHSHTHREEMMIVLEGEVIVQCGETRKKLQAGDVVGFPAGEEPPHTLINESPSPVTLLTIASASPQDQVIYK